MSITHERLPFNFDDLEPFVSEEALTAHYEKHHRGYVEKLNEVISGTHFSDKCLTDIVLSSEGDIYQNAAQVWNHNFYWQCLTPDASTSASTSLLIAIEDEFESFENFKERFAESAYRRFGSGWTWLVKSSSGKLNILNTINADSPATDLNTVPLLVIDVWEHAYLIDYRDDRIDYLKNFWKFVNWRFVSANFQK